MYVKTIPYVDYDGNERTEDFYFNMEPDEVVRFQASVPGGIAGYINTIVKAQKTSEIIEVFEKLIAASYGIKSNDGRRFIKNEEVLNDFKQTKAYSKLFMELGTNDDAAAEFLNGIMPPAEEEKKPTTPAKKSTK